MWVDGEGVVDGRQEKCVVVSCGDQWEGEMGSEEQ